MLDLVDINAKNYIYCMNKLTKNYNFDTTQFYNLKITCH